MFLQRRATGSLVCCSNMFKMSFLILKVWVTFCKPPFLVSYFRFGHHQPPYPQQAGIGISNKRKVPGRCWWELGTFKGWRITRYYKGILKRTPAVYVCLSMLAYPPGLFWLFVLCHYPSSGTGPGWILLDMLAVPHSNLFWELRNCHFWDSMSGFDKTFHTPLVDAGDKIAPGEGQQRQTLHDCCKATGFGLSDRAGCVVTSMAERSS